jgi:TFIIF-interacting CTD phosphatase-like protein
MDETLVHASLILPLQAMSSYADFMVTLKNGARFGITVRPYVHKVLEYLSQYYEMAIFTAADQEYADMIID